jgi:hypothetical protein
MLLKMITTIYSTICSFTNKVIMQKNKISPGDVLLSQGEIPQLPSALKSLTSVFGMGTGVTSSPLSPDEYSIEGLFLQN